MSPNVSVWREKPWRSPDKERCRRLTRKALSDGVLQRPDVCDRCGDHPAPTRRGYASIQAHHPDYAQPLLVEWLCAPCHRAVTPMPSVHGPGVSGADNSQAKLTEDAVRMIRARYVRGVYGYRSLAAEFGVTRVVIKAIILREAWKQVA